MIKARYETKCEYETSLTHDYLELAMSEFRKKFNFEPSYFLIGVPSQYLIRAFRMGESYDSSDVAGFDIRFFHDRTLKNTEWYVLSINNGEAYQLVM